MNRKRRFMKIVTLTLMLIGIFTTTLTNANAQTCTNVPIGLGVWYTGDGDYFDRRALTEGNNVFGTTFAPGKVSQAFSFGGQFDLASFPSAVENRLTDYDFTIETWVYFNNLDDLSNAIAGSYGSDGFGDAGWVLNIDNANGGVDIMIHESDADPSPTHARWPTSNFTTGQWYHVAATRRGTALEFWVDG